MYLFREGMTFTLTLTALIDIPDEGNETVIVELHQSANYVISGSPTLILTILDRP